MRDVHPEVVAAAEHVRLIDHHVHGVWSEAPTRHGFAAALNEVDTDPPASDADPFDSQLGFAVRAWCAPVLDLPRHVAPDAYWGRRVELGEAEVTRRFLRGAGVDEWFIDTGFLRGTLLTPDAMATASGGVAREVVRLETLAEDLASAGTPAHAYPDALRAGVADAARTAVGAKTVLAYRCGFDVDLTRPSDSDVRAAYARWLGSARPGRPRLSEPTLLAFGIHEALEQRLPLQVHVGLGDRDLDLNRCDPLLLTGFLRTPEARRAPVLLLHCYPFERQAGYLAQGFANVHLDVGLALHHLGARGPALLARSLELAPFDRLLYSSDAVGPAELHYLGARRWRTAVARVVGGFVADDEWSVADAVRVVRLLGRENALRVYTLPGDSPPPQPPDVQTTGAD